MVGDGSMTVRDAGRLGGKRNAQNRRNEKIMEEAVRRAGLMVAIPTIPSMPFSVAEQIWVEQQLAIPLLDGSIGDKGSTISFPKFRIEKEGEAN